MHTTMPGKNSVVTALLASALLLSACDSGESDKAAIPAATSSTAEAQRLADDVGATDRETRAVISENMPYAEVSDELVYGYFVAPSDMFEPLPAVIMIHEWWGLNDDIRAAADRLASQGYIVLAIDLFGGQTASNPAAARQLMLSVVEDPESANQNIRSAFEFVSSTAGAPRVGAIGWRFGGTWALNIAMLFPDELNASVIYYGPVTDDEDKLRPVNAPILGLFAANDVSIKIDEVEAFKASLERLRKEHEIQIYAGVGQRFANQSAESYDATAADDAWNRTLRFLELHLAADDTSVDGS